MDVKIEKFEDGSIEITLGNEVSVCSYNKEALKQYVRENVDEKYVENIIQKLEE